MVNFFETHCATTTMLGV